MFDKDVVFKGKHASYVKQLTEIKFKDKSHSIFKRNVDIYMIAPIVGLLFNCKSTEDKSEYKDTKIFLQQIIDNQDIIKYNFTIVLLCHFKQEINLKIVRSIFNIELLDNDIQAEYLRVYNSYLLGGIEILHNKIFEGSSNIEEIIENIYAFLKAINMRYHEELDNDFLNKIYKFAHD